MKGFDRMCVGGVARVSRWAVSSGEGGETHHLILPVCIPLITFVKTVGIAPITNPFQMADGLISADTSIEKATVDEKKSPTSHFFTRFVWFFHISDDLIPGLVFPCCQ